MQQFKAFQFYEKFVEHFYLDADQVVRRKLDGYLGRFKAGDPAKFFQSTGDYWYIQIPGVRGTAKRAQVVYSLAFGRIPEGMDIDHIDGDRNNDHPSNLRLVTRAQNNRNRSKRSDNTSGITGIRWSEYHQHYVIRRTVGEKRLSTSRKTLEEAVKALEEYKKLDASYSERHGM